MRLILLGLGIFFLVAGGFNGVQAGVNDTFAELKTTDGLTYKSCTVTKVEPDGITIMHSDGATKVPFSKLPPDIQQKYNYDPVAADKYSADLAAKRQALVAAKLEAAKVETQTSSTVVAPASKPTTDSAPVPAQSHNDSYEPLLAEAENSSITTTLKLTDAFGLSELEEAKRAAIAQNKPLGFIMVWGQFFGEQTDLISKGSVSATAHFYYVFKDHLILIFVRHETELGKVPEAVKKGFFGPEEGGFSPNMAVTDPSAQTFVCEIPYGGNDSNGAIRTKVFRDGIAKIHAAQAQWDKAAQTKPVP
jgi:hypothetical protein